ncbi:hypothetical protein [Lysinibacillus pakistanensis]|uniref:Lipoprotein n=1 Tax=Lysinibacillus pakistanensis TaxID=759811 RepID=A0AAX3WUA4_9BACI|nr:hypothetical protein [Lysinibacillus pakistanensis]MDM5229910.1 hypothetical protein [Lysinibacillus pakistanensis]WHY45510.1 hypothetical protein QNH22_19670 [Lysinibacillus pakistanensis]WHY50518.1 hypothetical protein QNH24_19635 [Lysinibacillus pakistanensis]
MKKKLVFSAALVLSLGLGACGEEKQDNDKVNADSEIVEAYSREITAEEQEYIQLVINDDFDTLITKTEGKANEIQQDYNNLGLAFEKFNGVDENLPRVFTSATLLKYEYVLKKLEEIKYIPDEIKEKVNELIIVAKEKEEKWIKKSEENQAIYEAEDEKRELEFKKSELEFKINKRTMNPKAVYIGMTKEEVLVDGWGKPIDINRTTTTYGVSEQWIYEDYKYLYFEDGILTTIQD